MNSVVAAGTDMNALLNGTIRRLTAMKYKTPREYRAEIARVKSALERTDSEYLRNDYGKYLKRLQREYKRFWK